MLENHNITPKLVIGTISGTSMDAIDVALIETNGLNIVRPLGGASYPYTEEIKEKLIALINEPQRAAFEPLKEIENEITNIFSQKILQFIYEKQLNSSKIDLIGFHGQTIFHNPEIKITRQLGDGALMAKTLNVPVVNDFRSNDVANGGQGAPLVPLYHASIAHNLEKPVIILNLGGVANLTYIMTNEIYAFDCGPASALIDDAMRKHFNKPYDEGGKIAAIGKVDKILLESWVQHPFFKAPFPKSLDRNAFRQLTIGADELQPEDKIATLTAFTISSCLSARALLPQKPKAWFITGGGRYNKTIIEGLSKNMEEKVSLIEEIGYNGDLLEAECFGYLAVRSLYNIPISLPTTTGVLQPLSGGRLFCP